MLDGKKPGWWQVVFSFKFEVGFADVDAIGDDF